MSRRKVPLVPGEYYHIYNRGNNKQSIFFDEKDYKKFVKYLYLCNTKKHINFRDNIVDTKIDAFDFDRVENLVSIGAWVLMPNHFHLYLTISPRSDLGEIEKGGRNEISEFMRKLSTAYVSYLNTKYDRTGGLFEGPFKSVHIDNDNQARCLFSYIHLNPVKLIDKEWKEKGVKNIKKTLNFLKTYKWSSYADYVGVVRLENKIIEPEYFPFDFSSKNDFNREIFSWLSYDSDD